jgi:integrase
LAFWLSRRIRGFPRVRFHDLRHTHATQLLASGVHPKVVQERLGHSTIAITMDIYSHVTPGMQSEAVAKLDLARLVIILEIIGQKRDNTKS